MKRLRSSISTLGSRHLSLRVEASEREAWASRGAPLFAANLNVRSNAADASRCGGVFWAVF